MCREYLQSNESVLILREKPGIGVARNMEK